MKKRTLYHIAFWIGYVFFKTYLNFISSDLPVRGKTSLAIFLTMLIAQSSFLLVKVPMVYTLFRIIDTYLTRKSQILKACISIVILFLLSISVFILINQFIVLKEVYKINPDFARAWQPSSILYTFFILCFVAGIATAFKLIRDSIKQKEEGQEMMKKKLETELRFLKSQTNPHFLFNTLNNIYALARKKSDDTADVVMKLSKLLRFMLYESGNASIPITNEIKMIDDYIALEKIRYDDRLKITYRHTLDNAMHPIAPLLLLPFVENAFKHGVSETRFDSFIFIDIKLEDGQLDFMVENPASENEETNQTEKIGLNNVKRQLELMYPGHTLTIENNNNCFKVSLKINLLKHATV